MSFNLYDNWHNKFNKTYYASYASAAVWHYPHSGDFVIDDNNFPHYI